MIIGIVLLQVIDDGTSGPIGDGGSSAAAGGNTNTTTTSSGSGSSSTTSTTAANPVKPPAQVAVLVLNGSGRPGAATTQSNALEGQGVSDPDPRGRDESRRQHRVLQARLRP